jgi:thiosulfate/3-mercaptopyruvate sulfurtransferase
MKNYVSALVDVTWLHSHIDDPNLIVLDASVKPVVPGFVSVNGSSERTMFIPRALFFDLEKRICDLKTDLPHMMPTASQFEKEFRTLGINEDSIIVVYDDVGVYSSPRAWWMIRAMGHKDVAVLDGGLPAWLEAGLPVSESKKRPHVGADNNIGNFVARQKEAFFVNADIVAESLCDKRESSVLDARTPDRFYAKKPEPRAGVRGGHIPGSKNLPFPIVLNNGYMKDSESLRKIFENFTDLDHRIIFTCGSGLTACVLLFGAYLVGFNSLSLYDGSWADWGADLTREVSIK